MFEINSKSKILLASEVCYLLGNCIYGLFEKVSYLFFFSAFFAIIILFFTKRKVLLFCLIILSTLVGGFYFYTKDLNYKESQVLKFEEKEIQARGVILSEPEKKDGKQKHKIELHEIEYQNKKYQTKDTVLVRTEPFPEFSYGDEVIFFGSIKKAGIIEDFNYEKYLLKEGIVAVSYDASLEKLSEKNGRAFLHFIYKIKNSFIGNINSLFLEPEASFLAGLLIGERRSIPEKTLEAFSLTGTTHIIAISGYNITLISALVTQFLKRFFRRKIVVLLVLISLFIFVIITGAEASVVRAGIMGAVVLLSKTAGRLSNVTSVLVLTAVLMSLINPFVIVHDIGFQLSYLSTLGLLYFADPITRKISFVPKKFEMRDSLALTLASQITTFPITVYHFGRLSIIAPLVNVLVLPLIPFSMFQGFFATMVAYFSKGFGQLLAWPAYLCLKLKILIISFFSSLPFVSIEITKNIKTEVLLLYGVLFFFYFVFKKIRCTKNTSS